MREDSIQASPDTLTGGKLDSAVMIRFIEEQNGQIFFKSGEESPAKVIWKMNITK